MKVSNDKVFSYKTKREGFYRRFFKSINGILSLTDREMDVLAKLYEHFDNIKSGVSDDKMANELLFSTGYRKKIREELQVSSLLLNNYIKSLKDKNIVIEKDGVKSINNMFLVDFTNKNVSVKFHL